MKMRWVWFCGYDAGHGEDRECCYAGSRKPVDSETKAQTQLQKHFDKTNHDRSSWGYERRTGNVRKLQKHERWK